MCGPDLAESSAAAVMTTSVRRRNAQVMNDIWSLSAAGHLTAITISDLTPRPCVPSRNQEGFLLTRKSTQDSYQKHLFLQISMKKKKKKNCDREKSFNAKYCSTSS